jgi:hypothetical protein
MQHIDIAINWRDKYGWVPPSENPDQLARWKSFRSGAQRSSDGANSVIKQGVTYGPSELRRGPLTSAESSECGGEERKRTPLPASSVGPPFSKGVKNDGAS